MKINKPGNTILLTGISLIVLIFIQGYIILQHYRMKEKLFDIQYHSVVLNTLNQMPEFTTSPLDSAYLAFDAIALHNLPAFQSELAESARKSAGNQLKEVFLAVINEHDYTQRNIKEALKTVGLDTSFKISYDIKYLELIDFDTHYTIFSRLDSIPEYSTCTGLYLRSYQTEQDHYAASFDLFLDFTKKAKLIIQEMKGLIIIVCLTLIIVLTTFAFTLRSLWKQKKINTLKSDFIDNISHEFKTPLSSISVAASTIKHPSFVLNREKINELADSVLHQNKVLNQMIDQVIDVSLIENNKVIIHPEVVDMYDFLEEIRSRLLKEFPEKKILLQTSWDMNPDLKLNIDKNQIIRLLSNLFSNSVKYSDGIPEIDLSAKENGQYVKISLKDKGKGMDSETQRYVFDRFYRADSSRKNAKGLGLGLYIVKKIVDAHHGLIDISSVPGKGTRVNIQLPK